MIDPFTCSDDISASLIKMLCKSIKRGKEFVSLSKNLFFAPYRLYSAFSWRTCSSLCGAKGTASFAVALNWTSALWREACAGKVKPLPITLLHSDSFDSPKIYGNDCDLDMLIDVSTQNTSSKTSVELQESP